MNSSTDLKLRLRKIQGQVKGIEKMIDNHDSCREILIQISAIRAAINKVGTLLVEDYVINCIEKNIELNINNKTGDIKNLEELVNVLSLFLK